MSRNDSGGGGLNFDDDWIKLEGMGNLKVKTTPLRQSRPAVEGSISRCLFLVTGFNRLNQFNFITYVSTWQAFIDQPVFSLIVCYNKRNLEGSKFKVYI